MAVVANLAKRRLAEGRLAASFNISRLRTVEIPQIAQACGFHWVFIDLEHSTMDLDTAAQIAAAALTTEVTAIVRVPEGDVNRAARILDAGAQGVIFPHVENAEDATRFARACRFPPKGTRSLTYGGPQLEYEAIPPAEAMAALDAETLVVVMIETPEAVARAAEIAAVDGVDVVLVGGSDLSATMGIPGKFQDPGYKAAIGQVFDAARAAGKSAGIGGIYDEALMQEFIERGARFVLGGADMSFVLAGGRARAGFLNGLTLP